MGQDANKRKNGRDHIRNPNKRQKNDRKSVSPFGGRISDVQYQHKSSAAGITPGTSGVFVTCQRGHEFQCVGELYSLFDEVWITIAFYNDSFMDEYGQMKNSMKRKKKKNQEILN